MKTGTIDLEETLYIPDQFGQRANDNSFSVQFATDDISADTTFYMEFSLDKENWDQAIDPNTDEDISFTLSDNFFRSFEVDPGLYWRIRFASGNTGNISYTINDD